MKGEMRRRVTPNSAGPMPSGDRESGAAASPAAAPPQEPAPPHERPRDGEWYAPEGDDNTPGVDYFSDNRGYLGRFVSLAVLSVLVVTVFALAGTWFAAPLLETRIQFAPSSPSLRAARSHASHVPATNPTGAATATTEPAESPDASAPTTAPTAAPITSVPSD